MTHTLEVWRGGVVGIVKAELEIARNLRALHPELRVSAFDGTGFREIASSELEWLWSSSSVSDAWMAWRHPTGGAPRGPVRRLAAVLRTRLTPDDPEDPGLAYRVARRGYRTLKAIRDLPRRTGQDENPLRDVAHPYGENDLVLSYGWFGTGKERAFSRIKAQFDLTLVYMIYDLAMTRPDVRPLYGADADAFEEYLEWVSNNCDYLLFGGATAQADTLEWQRRRGLRRPPGRHVRHGSEVSAQVTSGDTAGDRSHIAEVLERLGVTEPYVLTVGAIDQKKNYDTLYRAYRLLEADRDADIVLPLIIAGGTYGDPEIADRIRFDPAISGRIVLTKPMDEELELLYEHASFVLLPSLYEGWSLTLPEALAKGKFCIVSDVAPLREIGGELVDYVTADDPASWADVLQRSMRDPGRVASRAARVKQQWVTTTWRDSAAMALDAVLTWEAEARERRVGEDIRIDISRLWSSLSGPRPPLRDESAAREVLLVRALERALPDARFFAWDGSYRALDKDVLGPLIGTDDPLRSLKRARRTARAALRAGSEPRPLPSPFSRGDVVLSLGDGGAASARGYREVVRRDGVRHVQAGLDLTSVASPHLVREPERRLSARRARDVHEVSSLVIAVGLAAARVNDLAWRRIGVNPPASAVVPLPIELLHTTRRSAPSRGATASVLAELGIRGPFVLAAGTIEAAANHETLYRAFPHVLEQLGGAALQLVFMGTVKDTFLDQRSFDRRLAEAVVVAPLTARNAEVLYAECAFTLAPAHSDATAYALGQSLVRGRFAVAADVPIHRELAGGHVRYADPYDTYAWVDSIVTLSREPELVTAGEASLRDQWVAPTWDDVAADIIAASRELPETVSEAG